MTLMKKFATAILLFFFLFSEAQSVTKYYDADWQEARPEKAMYVAEFTKTETGYKCLSYWKSSKKKREESLYADTSMSRPNGLQKVYHKNGNLEDSVVYSADGKMVEAYHYYSNKQLEAHYIATADGKGVVREAYDETGSKIKNYIYLRPAEPKGGANGWKNYFQKAAPKDLTSGKPEPQTVHLKLSFYIDPEGNVAGAKIIESSGLRAVDQEAIRAVYNSPKWTPAIYKNKALRVPVVLPMTYELPAAK